jgi:hypothetical protein
MEKDFPSNWILKAKGVPTFISEQSKFKPQLFRREKDAHVILTKGIIQQEEITVNKYTSNASVYNVIKQTTKHRNRDRLKHNNCGLIIHSNH